jgi:hypothetical protein
MEAQRINQGLAEARNYLLAQAELGVFELALKEPLKPLKQVAEARRALPSKTAPAETAPFKTLPTKESDSLWQTASNLNEFYASLQQHSLYQKRNADIAGMKLIAPRQNAPFLLIFHSPKELSAEASEMLKNLFKKLGADLGICAISFFMKCNSAAMPREKAILTEMLKKEIALLNPEKIILFRENGASENSAKIDGSPIILAEKPAIRLYSPLEMLPSKEKRLETWNLHLPRSGWFGIL